MNEDLEAKSTESPAKRRAPVQNICDNNEAPEVQNKAKMVQIGQDSPKDSPEDPPQDPPNPQMNKNRIFLSNFCQAPSKFEENKINTPSPKRKYTKKVSKIPPLPKKIILNEEKNHKIYKTSTNPPKMPQN